MPAPQPLLTWLRRPENPQRLARVTLLVFFAWLAGRFWHPYYGFTRFLQMDAASLATTLPELRAAPIFTYDAGYDGHYYAQLAARPLVHDPALAGAIDSVGYRARRMLLSWTAWVVGGGDAVRAVRAYAWLNLVVWAALAALLWEIFPARSWRETAAWGGMLFSAGALHSVRLALTDLLALLLVAGAAWRTSQGKRGVAAACLGLGGLARETALLGAITLLPEGRPKLRDVLRAAILGALVALPLVLWLLYLRATLGWTEPGMGNFALPAMGWAQKWGEAWARLRTEPDRYLALTTLLAHVALTVQLVFLLVKPKPADHWWRLGAVYAALLFFLGTAVWEGHPGAASRVLLPLALAFNVLAVRARAAAGWFVLGNLSVLSGVLIFWQVPQGDREVAAGRSFVAHVDERWQQPEHGRRQTWVWSGTEGGLRIDFSPRREEPVNVRLALRGMTPRPLEILQAGRVVWAGNVGAAVQWVELPALGATSGRLQLEFHSPAAPVRENAAPGARELGFALYGVRVD